jgi:hypothetical protein
MDALHGKLCWYLPKCHDADCSETHWYLKYRMFSGIRVCVISVFVQITKAGSWVGGVYLGDINSGC